MFYFLVNVKGGLVECHLLDSPMVFFVISHIIFSILDINVHSITNCKVFGVTFGVNLLLPIIELRFHDYKHVVEVENMKLGSRWSKCKFKYRSGKLIVEGGKCNFIVQVAKMVLDARG